MGLVIFHSFFYFLSFLESIVAELRGLVFKAILFLLKKTNGFGEDFVHFFVFNGVQDSLL